MSSRKLEERLKQIESFIAEGLTRGEIAEKLGMKYGNFTVYLSNHPEITRPNRKKRERNKTSEKYKNIKGLLEEDLTREELAEKLGYKYGSFCSYLSRHPELSRPIRKREKEEKEKYGEIKGSIDRGLNQTEIAEKLGISRQAVNNYLDNHPELRKIYDEQRRNRK
jgi:transcriptional regulator with XRE-family HTH domain